MRINFTFLLYESRISIKSQYFTLTVKFISQFEILLPFHLSLQLQQSKVVKGLVRKIWIIRWKSYMLDLYVLVT